MNRRRAAANTRGEAAQVRLTLTGSHGSRATEMFGEADPRQAFIRRSATGDWAVTGSSAFQPLAIDVFQTPT